MLFFSLLLACIALGPSWTSARQLQQRDIPDSAFQDDDSASPRPDWQQMVRIAFNDARALAEAALRIEHDHPNFNVYFRDNNYETTIREVYQRIIAFIDNPPPGFRIRRTPSRGPGTLAAAQRGTPERLRVFEDFFDSPPTFVDVPIMTTTRAEMDRTIAERGPAILHELAHIVTQDADFPWPNLPEEFLQIYRTVYTPSGGAPQNTVLMVEDIRPLRFRDGMGDVFINLPLIEGDEDVAYNYQAYTGMRNYLHGAEMTLFNAQNYAGFALAAFRNGNPTTGMVEEDDELSSWHGFADSPSLDLNLNFGTVRAMRVAVEVWSVYNLVPDLYSKPKPRNVKKQWRRGRATDLTGIPVRFT